MSNLSEKIQHLARDFESNGYGFIEDFLTPDEVESLRSESMRLVKEESTKERQRHIFANSINQKNDYFINSGDKVRFFFEKKALDEEGRLIVPEDQSLAKIGHALHTLNPIFKSITNSEKIKQVFRAIDFIEPTVMQSMVIFKNPKVGGEYTPHQDASFLCTEPIHLAGIWLALDDATELNGCMEFIPGSHRWPLARRFIRTKNQNGDIEIEWDKPVAEYESEKFVKVPVKKGSLVLIHGLVVHRSASNESEEARWVYTFHAYDKGRSTYLKDNWLQVPDNFVSNLYKSDHRKEIEQLADELARDYLNYVLIDTSAQKKKVEETIEECLTHMEEVFSVLDNHRHNSADIASLLDQVSDKKNSLEKLYKQVDSVEQYLVEINEILTKLESYVDDIEAQNKPVRGKIRKIIELLPRLSLNNLTSLMDNSNTQQMHPVNTEDVEDNQLSLKRSSEIVAQVTDIEQTVEKSSNNLRARLGGDDRN